MNPFVYALRTLFKNGQGNAIKILSLAVGLAMGLVLIGKVYFELTYDNFYPDSERIYQIQSNFQQGDEDPRTFGQVSGAVSGGFKAEIPQVEEATWLTFLGRDLNFYTPDKQHYTGGAVVLADNTLFDVIPRPMLIGDAREALSTPSSVLISRSVAERLGGVEKAVGKSFFFYVYPNRELKVAGVFQDIPENSHIHYDIVISRPSVGDFMWDGTSNWLGNDRYIAYVKLLPGVDPATLSPAIQAMQEKHQDMELMKKADVDLTYSLIPLTSLHSDNSDVKRMVLMLSLLAFAILFTAVLNYVLVVVSTLVTRTREVAIRKCYGAEERNVTSDILAETLFHLLISLALAAALIYLFRNSVLELMAVSLSGLFNLRSGLFLLLVCTLVFVFTGLVPARIYAKIPVMSAIRSYKESRRVWKLFLLSFQFAASVFLVSLLTVVALQYNRMINDKPGYSYENVLYMDTWGANEVTRNRLMDELSSLKEVEAVASSEELPIFSFSGNNVYAPEEDRHLFNFADFYGVDRKFLKLMDIPIVEGKNFDENSSGRDVLVSRSFAENVSRQLDLTDGVVGKSFRMSEHGLCTVVGVYSDVRIGSIAHPDHRPTVMFFSDKPEQYVTVKLSALSSDNILKVGEVARKVFPDGNITPIPYKTSMVKMYDSSRLFRNSVLIGGIITLVIALIGLIGYTNDEVNRRRAEVAIRKINGASTGKVQRLFLTDILKIALPSLLVGCLLAVYASARWMENFSEKVSLSALLFILSALLVALIVISVVLFSTYRAAVQNPVKTLKSD